MRTGGTSRRARTPRGFVRLHKVNHQPGNFGFTLPIAMTRRMADQEGALFRAVLIPEGVLFVRVPDHAAPKAETDQETKEETDVVVRDPEA